MKYACPVCNAEVSSVQTECYICHAKFANEYRCSRCNSPIDANASRCEKCGADFSENDLCCPSCGELTSINDEKCPRCGAKFAKDVKCGICGSKVEPDDTVCGKCKSSLVGPIFVENIPKASSFIKKGLGTGLGSFAQVQVMPMPMMGMPGMPMMPPMMQPQAQQPTKETEEKGEQKAKRTESVTFPFTAIVGQELMKLVLILNAIDPEIGGVLISGEKGSGKSVSVRGLAEVLPPIQVVSGCRFNCDPDMPGKFCFECKEKYAGKSPSEIPRETRPMRIVDLPLNATEDRVVGAIDVQKIISQGLKSFEHGLLAEANRGLLYVDEINLLDDYIVDVLLDAAAMGVCKVERESVSITYPARFIIVGSMNPEEGNLRPQLLDRIALHVKVEGLQTVKDRVEIIKLRNEFNRDPQAVRARFADKQNELRERIVRARELLPQISIDDNLLETVAKICLEFDVDGHRADIIISRTARAHAAFMGRTKVERDDVIKAAELALPHRMRRKPFEEEEFNAEKLKQIVEERL